MWQAGTDGKLFVKDKFLKISHVFPAIETALCYLQIGKNKMECKKKSVFDCPHFVLFNNQFIVSKEDKLTLPKVVYNRSPFVQVVQVCKIFGLFIVILWSKV